MASPFEGGDERGQAWPDQSATLDRRRQGGVMDPAAVGAIGGRSTMPGGAPGHGLDLDLLHNAWRRGDRLQPLSTVGTPLQRIKMAAAVELFRWQQWAQVERVAGLATASTRGGIVGQGWFGRFDQIGGRWFGR